MLLLLVIAGHCEDLSSLARQQPDAPFKADKDWPESCKYEEGLTNRQAWDRLQECRAAPKVESQGLRILGIEFSAGNRDRVQGDAEPYLRKGAPQLFDWDIRARIALDGLGGRAVYRHPGSMRSFSVGALKYFDLPKTLGLDSARDDIYHAVGQTPDKPQGGFEVNASGAVNQYVGGTTSYDQKEVQKGDRWSDKRSIGTSVGYSPLGDNTGKTWNYTLIGGLSHESLSVRQPGYESDRSGLGYAFDVAFQKALNQIPVPVARLDRLKTKLGVSQSAVSSFAVNAAAEVSFYLIDHLELTGGVKASWRPSPGPDPEEKTLSAGGIVGVDIHY